MLEVVTDSLIYRCRGNNDTVATCEKGGVIRREEGILASLRFYEKTDPLVTDYRLSSA